MPSDDNCAVCGAKRWQHRYGQTHEDHGFILEKTSNPTASVSDISPGPWFWEDESLMFTPEEGPIDKLGCCVMYCPGDQWPPSDGDRRLIAAAPEMLDLLRWFTELASRMSPTHQKVAEANKLLRRIDGM